jgi:hypothetical protein
MVVLEKLMRQFVTVSPISSKAKNRFANIMGGINLCEVEQRKDGKLFLSSKNQKYFFWVKESFDKNWTINDRF